jgi:transcriptional regulator with XRE-family HTH domain
VTDVGVQILIETYRSRPSLPAPAMARAIREQSGLSQEALAAAVGVTRPAISRYECGRRSPRDVHRKRYAEVLAALPKEVFG